MKDVVNPCSSLALSCQIPHKCPLQEIIILRHKPINHVKYDRPAFILIKVKLLQVIT